jgi:hypothetical protein
MQHARKVYQKLGNAVVCSARAWDGNERLMLKAVLDGEREGEI